MTHNENDWFGRSGDAVSELRLGLEDDECHRECMKLAMSPGNCQADENCGEGVEEHSSFLGMGKSFGYWIRLLVLCAFLGMACVVVFKWVGPFFIQKVIIPILHWETVTFNTPELVVLVFASIALFPSLLLPSSPSMWLAGMTFGYGFGFLLIMPGVLVGVSLPYFIGSLFHHKIQTWLEKYPKRASVLRAAGEGDWFHQFRAVTLIRLSPFPYILYNYCAVATNVRFGPYILGSFVGMVPDVFAAIYTGILFKTLADASHRRHSLSASQIVVTLVGFGIAVTATIFCTIYAKRQLKELKPEDQQLLASGVS